MTPMIELADKDNKSYYNYIAYAQEARGKIKYVQERQEEKFKIELLEVKTMMSEIKNTLYGINSRLDMAKEKKIRNLKMSP